MEEIALRGLDQFEVDAGELFEAIQAAAQASPMRLMGIRFRQDPRLRLMVRGRAFAEALVDLKGRDLNVETRAFSSW
jgi:hypothetical protein